MKNRLRNILTLVLVVTAIYQTGQLWFGGNSSHNFFYILINTFASDVSYPEEKALFALPYRIISNAGSQTFQIAYSDIKANRAKELGDEVLKNLLSKGEYTGERQLDWNELFKNRAIIYDYAFTMPTDIFTNCFDIKGSILSSKSKSFQSIFIIPARSSTERVKVLFVDETVSTCYEYLISVKNHVNEGLNSSIDEIAQDGSAMRYFASGAGLGLFYGNVFIADLTNSGHSYHPIYTTNPYESSGAVLLRTVEPQISMFFDNPIAKLGYSTKDDVYVYYDETTVVKYYQSNVLEYVSYKAAGKNTSSSLLSDYCAAIGFIRQDTNVVNDYYLAGYTQEENKRTFYFDYAINNFPLALSDSLKKEISDISGVDLNHPIEITVENQYVLNYKKICYNFHTDNGITENASVDFQNFINGIFDPSIQRPTSATGEALLIERLELCYKLEKSPQLFLNWLIQVNGTNFFRPTKTR